MIIMNVAEGIYDYFFFLIPQDNTYRVEEEAVDKAPDPAGGDQDEVVDAPADNIFITAFAWSVTPE